MKSKTSKTREHLTREHRARENAAARAVAALPLPPKARQYIAISMKLLPAIHAANDLIGRPDTDEINTAVEVYNQLHEALSASWCAAVNAMTAEDTPRRRKAA